MPCKLLLFGREWNHFSKAKVLFDNRARLQPNHSITFHRCCSLLYWTHIMSKLSYSSEALESAINNSSNYHQELFLPLHWDSQNKRENMIDHYDYSKICTYLHFDTNVLCSLVVILMCLKGDIMLRETCVKALAQTAYSNCLQCKVSNLKMSFLESSSTIIRNIGWLADHAW